MLRIVLFVLLLSLRVHSAYAAVELGLPGRDPVVLEEVYRRDGTVFLAVEEVLAALGLKGEWNSVQHRYRIVTPHGAVFIAPDSHYLRHGERLLPLSHPPRFIDGRLRISAATVQSQLADLLGRPVHFRDLAPPEESAEPESTLDRLFAFLLRREKALDAPALRAVAIDPAHGGDDPGVIGMDGLMEKQVTLAVARRLERQIKMNLGIPVYLSRNGDYALSRVQRLAALNQPEVDVLLLLHAQAAMDARTHGVTLFVRPVRQTTARPGVGDDSVRLARHLEAAFRGAGIRVNSVVGAPLLPLTAGELPTVLIELGYLSHPTDQARLGSADGQEQTARLIFQALKTFAEEQQEL
ncbi:N-acetylmuramoyl-L-alanine amidase [Desulfuromonas sp. CSMB_57]|jgi:N-acetylmuramoyl-L-alanine amidase|uniref:N-acetylmuramoyl-L-alanine amidase n=1 Tax=Desulfuromonas sp. CSMB_57 TaxID=2807629 RepID=UPI001CD482A2|nr:N-acetylmuramoyl-L-alanine amidase [Desulfuromonas sp. CSMB_57]